MKFDKWHGEGACEKIHARLYVVSHDRDCDGTPLYTLAPTPVEDIHTSPFGDNETIAFLFWGLRRGFPESSLTPIEVTDELCYGTGALEWDREQEETEEDHRVV